MTPGFDRTTDRKDWETPDDLFAKWDAEFGPFTLDAAASPENAKCARYFTEEDDALSQKWTGVVWCNPPYGRGADEWLAKAWLETRTPHCERVVLLLPARTDTRWFHNYVIHDAKEVRFLKGRVTFKGAAHPAPFPSMLVVFE